MEEYENRSAGSSETWGEDESRVFVEYGRTMVPGREEIERTILDLIPAEPDEPFLGVEIGTGADGGKVAGALRRTRRAAPVPPRGTFLDRGGAAGGAGILQFLGLASPRR